MGASLLALAKSIYYRFEKSRKRTIIVIESYLKDGAFKAVKRDVKF